MILLTNFFEDFIKPFMQVLVIKQIEMFIVLFELNFSNFWIGNIRLWRRRQLNSINDVA
jgi:hypothetical protein